MAWLNPQEDLQLISGYVALLLGMGMTAGEHVKELVFECLVEVTPKAFIERLVDTLESLHQVQMVANRKLLQLFGDGAEEEEQVAEAASDSLAIITAILGKLRRIRQTL